MVLAIKSRDQRKGEKQWKSIRTKGLAAGDKKLFQFKSNIILFLTKRGFDKQNKKRKDFIVPMQCTTKTGVCTEDAQKIKSAKSCTYRQRNDMI